MKSVAITIALGAALLTASPAAARNDFENGFEDQLGRIAAYHVAYLGRHLLLSGLYAAQPYDEGWRSRRYEGRRHRSERRHYRYEEPCDDHGYEHRRRAWRRYR